MTDFIHANQHANTSKDKDRLTISPVLKGVLALEELASGVVSFTDPTGIQRGLGAQNLVTAYRLHTQKTHISVARTRIKSRTNKEKQTFVTTSKVIVLQVTNEV